MIVKDEEHVIARALESVKPFIDTWVIVDTGSTDRTQEIIKEVLKEIPGTLYESSWRDFGTNRTEALEWAQGKGEYLLFMDADDWLEYPEDFTFPELTKDVYEVWRGTESFSYLKPQLVKANLPWHWVGVTHEYLTCNAPIKSAILENIWYASGDEGARQQDGQKSRKDIALLEEALKEDPTNSRHIFYLAESYRYAGEWEKAIEWYQIRAAKGGFDDVEVFWSLYQIASLKHNNQYNLDDVIACFHKAHRNRPHRIEPVYFLAKIYNSTENFALAYECLKGREFLPKPERRDVLFNEDWMDTWGSLVELSICTYYLGFYQESIDICDQLLIRPLPENIREQVIQNRAFPEKKMRQNERFVYLNGQYYDHETVSKLITIITTTNPIPSIPDTQILQRSQASLFRIPALARCKKIIVFDGIQPGFEERSADYELYKENVRTLTQKNPQFYNTQLVFCPNWVHLSGAISEAIKHVKTPFVFIHQHDFVLQKEFDLNGCVATMMANPHIKHLRFNRGVTNRAFEVEWDGEIDQVINGVAFVPLCRTFGWSDNDHLARTDYYTDFVLPKCGCCPMEHVLQPELKKALAEEGKEGGHAPFGTYLYGTPSHGGYFHHLDGREAWGR